MSKNSAFFEDLNGKIEAKQTWSAGVAFKRSNPLPLDAYSVFATQELAETYASTSSVAYPGQVVAYADATGSMVACVLTQTADGTGLELKQIGVIPVGDDKTVDVTASGAISIHGASEAADGTVPVMTLTDGKLAVEWKTLEEIGAGDGNDNTTYTFEKIVKGEGETAETYGIKITPYENGVAKTAIEIPFAVYTISEIDNIVEDAIDTAVAEANAYTDEQIGAIEDVIASLNHFKTQIVSSVEEVTEEGVLYLIKDESVEGSDKYDEYILVDGVATLIGDTTTDLSNYYDIDDIDGIVDSIETAIEEEATARGLIATDLATFKETVANTYATKEYVGAIPNVPDEQGNNKYEGLDVIGYINKKAQETLAAASGNSSETAASVKQQLDDYIGSNNTRVGLIETAIESIESQLTPDAQANVLEAVKVEGTALTIADDKSVNITRSALGVYSTTDVDAKFEATNGAVESITSAFNTFKANEFTPVANQVTQNKTDIASIVSTLNGSGEGEGRVAGLIEKVASHETAVTVTIPGLIAGVDGKADKNASDIATLQGTVGTLVNTTIPGISDRVTNIENVELPAIKENISSASGKITTLEGKVKTIEETTIPGLVSELGTTKTLAESNKTRLDAVEPKIATLIGSDADKSVREIANEVAASAVADAGHIKYSKVDALPEVGEANIIYLVSATTSTAEDNVYDEYMYLDGKWEKIGDTRVSLAGYATEEFVGTSIVDALKPVTDDIAAHKSVVASVSALGHVKSVADTVENGVQVAEDGTMSVAKVNVNTLVQTEGEEIIFVAGSAE